LRSEKIIWGDKKENIKDNSWFKNGFQGFLKILGRTFVPPTIYVHPPLQRAYGH
jgi:hypothetical protein